MFASIFLYTKLVCRVSQQDRTKQSFIFLRTFDASLSVLKFIFFSSFYVPSVYFSSCAHVLSVHFKYLNSLKRYGPLIDCNFMCQNHFVFVNEASPFDCQSRLTTIYFGQISHFRIARARAFNMLKADVIHHRHFMTNYVSVVH